MPPRQRTTPSMPRRAARVLVLASLIAAEARPQGVSAGLQDAGDAQAASEPASDAQGAGAQPFGLHGSLRTWYRGRFSGGDDDHDLRAAVDLGAGDERKDPVTLRFSGYLSWDLDGSTPPDDSFFELSDTFDQPELRLYELYADLHRVDGLAKVRFGRQMSWTTPVFTWFDGLSLESEAFGAWKTRLGLYGGLPVRHWRSTALQDEDLLAGAWAEIRPWSPTRVRAHWLHLEDETVALDGRDDLGMLEVWQAAGERLSLYGSTTVLESDHRDWRLRGTWSDPAAELTVQATFYELLQTQRELPLEIDPFYEQLLAYEPFRSTQLLVAKGLAEWLHLSGGLDVRRVSDDANLGPFNRDFERYYLTAVLRDRPLEDFELSLTTESWEGGGERIATWGADLSTERGRTRASLGSYYALYKLDVQQVEERDDVRTYYLRLVRSLSSSTRIDARYEYEDSDLDDFHTVRLGFHWRF